jgi:hypothetical protein
LPVPPPIHIETPSSTPPPGAPPPNTLPLGAVPQRPLPIAVGDPYAALGIRAGSFLLFPGVEFSAGHSSNVNGQAARAPQPISSRRRSCRSAPIGSGMRPSSASRGPTPTI